MVQTSYLPLKPDDALDPFRVDGTMAVRALIRELITARCLITLYAGEDVDTFFVTRILALEADTLDIDFSNVEASRDALLSSPFLTVVGAPGSVKIQFRISGVDVSETAGGSVLTASIPATGWRVQRRNAFRVSPPDVDHAKVIIRLRPGSEMETPLDDLSVGGLALLWPSDQPLPTLGATLRHCRIEAEHIAPIPCELRMVRVLPPAEGEPTRISAEFYAMPHTVSRQVQMYVMDVEKRARRVGR